MQCLWFTIPAWNTWITADADIYDNLASNDIITDTTANPKYRYYSRVQNQLFYRMPDGSYPLCIPSKTKSTGGVSLRELLIKECHDSPYMGHRGVLRTYSEMRKLFYWPGMRTMIEKYVHSCIDDRLDFSDTADLDEKYILLYFASYSDALSQEFTPWLMKAYNILKRKRQDFEVRNNT